jgi:hypothetical protein
MTPFYQFAIVEPFLIFVSRMIILPGSSYATGVFPCFVRVGLNLILVAITIARSKNGAGEFCALPSSPALFPVSSRANMRKLAKIMPNLIFVRHDHSPMTNQ